MGSLMQNPAPANNAVGYEEVVFYDMPGEWSPYFGKPTDEKDRLWDQLYTGEFNICCFSRGRDH